MDTQNPIVGSNPWTSRPVLVKLAFSMAAAFALTALQFGLVWALVGVAVIGPLAFGCLVWTGRRGATVARREGVAYSAFVRLYLRELRDSTVLAPQLAAVNWVAAHASTNHTLVADGVVGFTAQSLFWEPVGASVALGVARLDVPWSAVANVAVLAPGAKFTGALIQAYAGAPVPVLEATLVDGSRFVAAGVDQAAVAAVLERFAPQPVG